MNPEVQQRCIRWAKLGCVVFMYDMVGYNDSKPFTHAFLNDRLRRWGLSLATLQTWNSIRALDWLTSLPDVDPARIGCTGESGGGTQTFLLTALDDRIKVSAPVVMVSDTFQGGCVCENAAGLRHGTDNVEFAALCAPRPLDLGRCLRRLDGQDDDAGLPGDPRRLLAGRLDRPGRRRGLRLPPQLQPDQRNAVYAVMGRWLLGIDDPASDQGGRAAAREARGPRYVRQRASRSGRSQDVPNSSKTYLIATLERLIDDLAPSPASPSRWEAARELLATQPEDPCRRAHAGARGLDAA